MKEVTFSEVESNRFNMNVHRGTLENVDIKSLKRYIIGQNVDLLILRLPSDKKASYHCLNNLGFDIIHADSLVYYSVNLSTLKVANLRNELQFEVIGPDNSDLLKDLVPIIFEGYQNHYFSNPNLEEKKIIDGYIEWATNYAYDKENKISWYIKSKEDVIGFATCSFNKDTGECEGVLYGVLPTYSGRGIYSDIIRFTQLYFKDLGFKKMWVSTQLQNYSVQKVWIREGFFLVKAYETYHINSLLNFSLAKKKQYKTLVSEEMLISFAELSGDKNKLHFDSEYAKSLGFKDRIVHGMITQSYLSKIFGVDYPGEGTIFLSNKNVFLAPVYLNREYVVEVSTLQLNKNGLIQLLAKVTDESGNLCLLSYNKLMNSKFVSR